MQGVSATAIVRIHGTGRRWQNWLGFGGTNCPTFDQGLKRYDTTLNACFLLFFLDRINLTA
jgi:hypothetical protein